ncbi:MAG TPA: hypothetical protein DDW52_15830 [Planctomycetaceae bacterium]|nr:hypothetical protein [Planctomycetaceae bacterium]
MPKPDDQHSSLLAKLHGEQADVLRRVAWTIVRDWQMADDAVQETFATLLKKIDQVWSELQLDDETDEQRVRALTGWLVKTVQFHSLNLRRRRGRAERREGKLIRDIGERVETPIAPSTLEDLQAALLSLPPAQHEIVRRRTYEGQTFQEIAQDLNLPLGTVLSRMRLALAKLRKLLDESNQ